MRPELHLPAQGSAVPARAVVVDTNIVLDLLLFADPAVAPLRGLLAQQRLDWVATAPMRDELACVLRYPHLQPRMAAAGLAPEALLAAFAAQARLVDVAPRAPCVCKDADDQKFIDLAVAHGAILLSKDRAVLSLRKRLLAHGAQVATAIVIEATEGLSP